MLDLIKDVKIKQLKSIPDDRGTLTEILRNDEEIFSRFGQIYITTCYPGIVKAWHKHRQQTDNIVIIQGKGKLILLDDRLTESMRDPLVNKFFMGVDNPLLVQVPPNVWHGFTPIGNEPCTFLNIPDKPYNYENPDEARRDPNFFVAYYNWFKNWSG
jgi:dTDP-4-dehydrorhamnose 3,5-epimerase